MAIRGKDGADYDDVDELMKANAKWEQQERQNKLLEEQNRLAEKQQNESLKLKEKELKLKIVSEKEALKQQNKLNEEKINEERLNRLAIEKQNKLLEEQLFLQVATPEEIEEYKRKKQEEKEAEKLEKEKIKQQNEKHKDQIRHIKETEEKFSKIADSLIDKLNNQKIYIEKEKKKKSIPVTISWISMFALIILGGAFYTTPSLLSIFLGLAVVFIIIFIIASIKYKPKEYDKKIEDKLIKIDYLKCKKSINDIFEEKYILSFIDILSKKADEFCIEDTSCKEYINKAFEQMENNMTVKELKEYEEYQNKKIEMQKEEEREAFEKKKEEALIQLEMLEDGSEKDKLRAKLEKL